MTNPINFPVYKKWFKQTNLTFKLDRKKKRLRITGNDRYMSDSSLEDFYLWLGRYLAWKKRLPKAMHLSTIAIKSQNVSKELKRVIAEEVREQLLLDEKKVKRSLK